jgi:hypothetical protein
MASGIAVTQANPNQTGVNRIAVLVVQDLFYPATLGALLYNFAVLFDDTSVWRTKPTCLSVVLILLYFTMDYIWTKLWTHHNPYNVIAALCDGVALILILLAERSIDPISGSDDAAHVARAALFLAVVHGLYTIWCAVEGMKRHLYFKLIFTVLFAINYVVASKGWDQSLLLFVVLQTLLCIGYIDGIIRQELP